jgi:hypothetical protein
VPSFAVRSPEGSGPQLACFDRWINRPKAQPHWALVGSRCANTDESWICHDKIDDRLPASLPAAINPIAVAFHSLGRPQSCLIAGSVDLGLGASAVLERISAGGVILSSITSSHRRAWFFRFLDSDDAVVAEPSERQQGQFERYQVVLAAGEANEISLPDAGKCGSLARSEFALRERLRQRRSDVTPYRAD